MRFVLRLLILVIALLAPTAEAIGASCPYTLPNTSANRARGVAGCIQQCNGTIDCGGGTGPGGEPEVVVRPTILQLMPQYEGSYRALQTWLANYAQRDWLPPLPHRATDSTMMDRSVAEIEAYTAHWIASWDRYAAGLRSWAEQTLAQMSGLNDRIDELENERTLTSRWLAANSDPDRATEIKKLEALSNDLDETTKAMVEILSDFFRETFGVPVNPAGALRVKELEPGHVGMPWWPLFEYPAARASGVELASPRPESRANYYQSVPAPNRSYEQLQAALNGIESRASQLNSSISNAMNEQRKATALSEEFSRKTAAIRELEPVVYGLRHKKFTVEKEEPFKQKFYANAVAIRAIRLSVWNYHYNELRSFAADNPELVTAIHNVASGGWEALNVMRNNARYRRFFAVQAEIVAFSRDEFRFTREGVDALLRADPAAIAQVAANMDRRVCEFATRVTFGRLYEFIVRPCSQ